MGDRVERRDLQFSNLEEAVSEIERLVLCSN
jgi:hypothetical protein